MNKPQAASLAAAIATMAIAAILPFPILPFQSPAQSNQGKNATTSDASKPDASKNDASQKGKAAPSGPTPRTPDGKPDLQGVWTPGNSFMQMGQPSLQPWAEELYKQRRANLSKDDPEGHCLPGGVPRISPFPQKIVQTPTLVVILDEGNIHSFRQIHLDRGHPKDLDPLWWGDSIGTWDGDTLVVDTIGFNDKTWLNGQGMPHSEDLHVIERISRPDLGHLQFDITLDDPKAFTKPHQYKRVHTLMENTDLLEYVCNEFNIDAEHLVGR